MSDETDAFMRRIREALGESVTPGLTNITAEPDGTIDERIAGIEARHARVLAAIAGDVSDEEYNQAVYDFDDRSTSDIAYLLSALRSARRDAERYLHDANARYEALAAEFYEESGLFAPGRSVPAAFGPQDDAKMIEAWKAFLARRTAEVRSSSPPILEKNDRG